MAKHLTFFLVALFVSFCGATSATADSRPNIVWISCEDISPNLGCYGDPDAITPNLDRLASEGVRFDRAFTPAGVCAVVRSSLITGMYAPAIGSQHMRSHIVPPPDVKAFPEYLRAAGYFCTNRDKTDYQFPPTPSIWDRQGKNHEDWRERDDPSQPFFSVINFTMTHESQVRHSEEQHASVLAQIGEENRHDPNKLGRTLPEYLPNTEAVRTNWAWYHDNITLMDKLAGEVLAKLEEDGLTESTIVVFWGDHGMGLPRGKRWIYDTGTHIPLIVRWPKHLDAGSVREDMTSILDLPPTMLDVAGVAVPSHMHGRILWGEDAQPEPSYLFFHRDRMDEVYELQRGCRDRRWKYIRNFEPEKAYSQHLDYMDQMPAMQDWRAWSAAGRLTGGQANWFVKTKPVEELYDTERDPWELTNLAELPQYAERLARMRAATEQWQERIGDTGMIPEPVLMEEMLPTGEYPRTEPVVIETRGGRLTARCETPGASIVYRLTGGDGKESWKLYTKSIAIPPAPIEFLACRLGFNDSRRTTWHPGEK